MGGCRQSGGHTDTSQHTGSYDGNCVSGPSGSGYWWWRSGTGWSRTAYSEYLQDPYGNGCTAFETIASGTFKNGVFCASVDVWNYVQGATVELWYDGGLSGFANSTWVSEPWWCPALHWHASLVRN